MLASLRLCAVSVDLDEIPNYHAIYGLPPPEEPAASAVYRLALSRLGDWAADDRIPLTLFCIGADVRGRENAELLRQMASAGHELANHSLDHFYDLSRRSREEIRAQIGGGADAIEQACGVRPKGFRAPGYVINDTMIDALIDSGHVYDTSVFPCPPYFAAKAFAMAFIAMRGRQSRSVQDHPRVLASPTRPYRVGSPYNKQGKRPLIELPVQVTRLVRLPFIGTTITLAGARRARWLTKLVVGEPVVSLELHGIDLLDRDDGLQTLEAHTPDVRVKVGAKLEALRASIGMLREAGYSFVSSAEASQRVAEELDKAG